VAVTGPDFISLQVRDLERSAAFYEQYLGLKRSPSARLVSLLRKFQET
jgi:catechol-2,3-dioxygenase